MKLLACTVFLLVGVLPPQPLPPMARISVAATCAAVVCLFGAWKAGELG